MTDPITCHCGGRLLCYSTRRKLRFRVRYRRCERCGSNSKAVALSAQTGWNELILDFDENLWFRNFNEDPMDVEIELASNTTGYVLVDDAIFAPLDLIDGTYWFLRGNNTSHTSWLVDDVFEFTDTGGAPATGKLQWWLYVAGLGYLPSSGTPTLADP